MILSRAVVLATTTAFVAVVYVGLVVVLGRSAQNRMGGGFWTSLLLTVVVALAFQPLRRRVVRFADRLAYGSRAAPYDALADFSHRIGQRPAPGTLLPTIAAAAADVVHADRAVVRFQVEGGVDLTAAWPSSPVRSESDDATVEHDLVVPVQDRHGALGSIGLDLPAGRDVRALERRLLSDIAEQAALAFRNARLQVELAARVEQLDQRAKELTASRNRIIGAGDTERERLESALGRRVLPAMTRLRLQLEEATRHPADPAELGAFADQATEALESLRELTRGIFPTMLPRSGLGPALASYVSRMPRQTALRIDDEVMDSRYSDRIEAAAYFCCVEALGHATDHLGMAIEHDGTDLVLTVHGVDLDGMDGLAVRDRVDACEGRLEVVRMHGQSSLRIILPTVGTETPVSVR